MNHTSTPVSRVRKSGLPPLRRKDDNSIVNKLMNGRNAVALLLTSCVLACWPTPAFAQTQTTGRIAGTVKDQKGALIVGADVKVTNEDTGEARQTTTNGEGSYSVSALPPGNYQVAIAARGFAPAHFAARVIITETTPVDAELGFSLDTITVEVGSPLVQSAGPQLGRIVDSRAVSELPLAARNFTQLLGLSTGTATALPDNGTIGRNAQNVSVNGARFTQNNFQINGIDANGIGGRGARLADPAPETIAEFKVQTSLYDATFGRAGGGNIQIVTKSGTNNFHGALYEYFSNDALNANNPFLKAAGARRPVLKRNYFGGTVGGPVRRDKIFFFASYQGIRERNGISNSISSNVLIAPGLTDDRSEQRLRTTFNLPSINPTAFKLLNARSALGEFLIPTPQVNGRYSGSSVSRSREDQFNANTDFRVTQNNWLAVKFFFAQTPQTLALLGAANVPGFPVAQGVANRLLSVQDVHTFNSRVTNEARFGFNFSRRDVTTQQAIRDADIGITRSTAAAFPGLPLIGIASNAGGVMFGTSALQDTKSTAPVTTFADTLSIARGSHFIRAGGEIRYYQSNFDAPALTRGVINFNTFTDFLQGRTSSTAPTTLANGITERNLRATDYNFFLQDDWKFSSKLTLNLGLRYELDLPPYDTKGRISTFDPSLYQPRLLVNAAGLPQGPPIGGIVQAGNPILQYDLPDVPNVGKRVLRSVDPNNFGPRVGFAYAPFDSGRLVLRGGYGIFHSRSGFVSINNSLFSPPFYLQTFSANATIENPFVSPGSPVLLPAQDQFPILVPGSSLFGFTFDRNNRTPYVQQYNLSAQFLLKKNMLWEVAYVGTRGLNLLRQVAINQARLASPQRPIINAVTNSITTNTPNNAQLRAPFQGVLPGNGQSGFLQDQSTAQSTYHSLQTSLTKRLSSGLQLLASYTYAKSIDNASGGNPATGTGGGETSSVPGDQLDNRANRGVSDFDRTHRFVLSFLWDLPRLAFARRSTVGRALLSNWQTSGVVTAMSGAPIDIIDGGAGTFYFGSGGVARPNWAPGATRNSATSNIPPGYFFNPLAFARPTVLTGQLIPSSNGTATAGATGTDFGNVGRNVLRGPRQTNVDFSVIKRFPIKESRNIEFRAEFFNLFNHVNFANPLSNLNAVSSSGGSIDPNTGQVTRPGDFGRIISTSNNPRIIQFAAKLNF